MGSIFKKMFSGGPKISLPGREAIQSDYLQFPGAQEAYKGYQSKIGVAPQMAQRYYDYMYQPTAEAARSQWSGYVEPEITSQMSARGMGRSSLVADLLRRSAQEREMGLAQYGGQLRQQGYEQGLGEENIGLAGLQDTAGRSADQQLRAANWQTDLGQRLYNANQETFKNQQAGAGRAISLISPYVNQSLSSPNMGGGGVSQYGNVYGSNTPSGVTDAGTYSRLPYTNTGGSNMIMTLLKRIMGGA